jgi:predicted nucleic acid-binding protein
MLLDTSFLIDLERGMPLVTRNPRHFQRVPNLQILSY